MRDEVDAARSQSFAVERSAAAEREHEAVQLERAQADAADAAAALRSKLEQLRHAETMQAAQLHDAAATQRRLEQTRLRAAASAEEREAALRAQFLRNQTLKTNTGKLLPYTAVVRQPRYCRCFLQTCSYFYCFVYLFIQRCLSPDSKPQSRSRRTKATTAAGYRILLPTIVI